jgi:CRISPR/Cas system-associated protein Cas10 (large subunit of type III CRISPR-Cas system)
MWACFVQYIYNDKLNVIFKNNDGNLYVEFSRWGVEYKSSIMEERYMVKNFFRQIFGYVVPNMNIVREKKLGYRFSISEKHIYEPKNDSIDRAQKNGVIEMLYNLFTKGFRITLLSTEYMTYDYSSGISCRVCGNEATLQEEGKEKFYCSEKCYFNK